MTDEPAKQLSGDDLAFLAQAAITSPVMKAAGIYSVAQVDDLPKEFIRYGQAAVPAIVFPWRSFTGETVLQLRPSTPIPRRRGGGSAKYVFAKGAPTVFDVHPMMTKLVSDVSVPLVICEGTKQHLAAISAVVDGGDYAVIGMPGCYGWSAEHEQTPDLRALATVLRGRRVILIFDADWRHNRDVWTAAQSLTEMLKLHGSTVEYVTVPGGKTTGLDDALANTIDPGAALRDLIGSASKTLGRRPAKSKAGDFFDEDGGLQAEKVASAILEDSPCALAMDGTIAVYQHGVFVIDPQGNALNAVICGLLGDRYRAGHDPTIKNMIRARLHAEDLRLDVHARSPWRNVENGMLDLDTFVLHPHDPKYLSTVQLPVRWDPDATCPIYDIWIKEVAGDQVELIEEITALMLDPTRTPTKTLFLYGPSRSGKSTFLRLMRAIAGDDHCGAVTLHALAADQFASADLYGKILNTAADLSSAHVTDISTWKMLTGEDKIAANRKYGQRFNFTNQALFAYSANEPPAVGEDSRAYYERMVPIRFGSSFAGKEDATLERRMLANELPGILRRWVLARRARVARGHFQAGSEAVRDEFATFSDRTALFVFEEKTIVQTVEGKDGSPVDIREGMYLPAAACSTGSDLYPEYQQWTKDNGYGALGRNKFYRRLTSVDGVLPVRRLPKGDRGFNLIAKRDDAVSLDTQADRQVSMTTSSRGSETTTDLDPTSRIALRGGSFSEKDAQASDALATGTPGAQYPQATGSFSEEPDLLPIVATNVSDPARWIYGAITAAPNAAKVTNKALMEDLGLSKTEFDAAVASLITAGAIASRAPARGYVVLGVLVHAAPPYVAPTLDQMAFRPRGIPDRSPLWRRVTEAWCIECGASTPNVRTYFPLCDEHQVAA